MILAGLWRLLGILYMLEQRHMLGISPSTGMDEFVR